MLVNQTKLIPNILELKSKQLKDAIVLDFTLREFHLLHVLFREKIGVYSIKDMLNSDTQPVKLIGFISIKLPSPDFNRIEVTSSSEESLVLFNI